VDVVKGYFDALSVFSEKDSLHRAIDRLGRARLALSPVDQALELGIAAEIALTHAETSGNSEITYNSAVVPRGCSGKLRPIGPKFSKRSSSYIKPAHRRCTPAFFPRNRK
jgi:hypothetical protein